MKLLEDLRQKYPMKEFPPYGSCIVVPGAEFDPDNEANLFDQGYKCFDTYVDGKPVTLVRVMKAEKGSGEKTVYSPPIAPIAATTSAKTETFNSRRWPENEEKRLLDRWSQVKGTATERSAALASEFPGRTAQAIMIKAKKMRRERGLTRTYSKHSEKVSESPQEEVGLQRVLKGKDTPLGPRWTEDEYRLLIKLWNERKKLREIAAEFPSRSGHAVGAALARLKNSGLIKPRWSQKKNRFSKVETSTEASVNASVEKFVPAEAAPLDKLISDVKGILDVLDVQGQVIDKLFCALLMQAVEVKQEKGDLSIPPGLWIHYANALLEDDKQYREKFRLKVEQLLEASA